MPKHFADAMLPCKSSGVFAERVNLYTLGYQGADLASYLGALVDAGIGVLVDVRQTAWSYKRDFCKTALKNGLASVGIEYIHLSSAGNPKENRRSAVSVAECLERFRTYLDTDRSGVHDLLKVIESVRPGGKGICLTCFEQNPAECHRTILIEVLKEYLPGIQQVDLGSSGKKQVRTLGVPEPDDHETARIHECVSKKEAQGVLF